MTPTSLADRAELRSRVAFRYRMHRIALDMGDVSDTLSALGALDAMLTGMEGSFDEHYPGMMVMASVPVMEQDIKSIMQVHVEDMAEWLGIPAPKGVYEHTPNLYQSWLYPDWPTVHKYLWGRTGGIDARNMVTNASFKYFGQGPYISRLDPRISLSIYMQGVGASSRLVLEVTGRRGKQAALETTIDPEVTSQLDALKKAREGLKAAKALLVNVQAIIAQFPEDKTAGRALADANTMIDRFTRHEANAAKVVRTMASKRMPPGLEKLADQVEKLIKKRMVDPKKLTLTPWIGVVNVLVEASFPAQMRGQRNSLVQALQFQTVFSIRDPGIAAVRSYAPSDAAADGARVTIVESSLGKPGQFLLINNWTGDKTTTAQEVVDSLVGQIDAWDGWVGGADLLKKRLEIAPKIQKALEDAVRNGGFGIDRYDNATVSKDGKEVHISFRTGLRQEDYGQYEDVDGQGRTRYQPAFTKALAPYAEFIEKPAYSPLGYGEKGWWGYTVNLK